MSEEKQIPKAAFSFIEVKIPSFSFNEPKNEEEQDISIKLEPFGLYDDKTGIFELKFEFSAGLKSNPSISIVTATVIATFRFNHNFTLDNLPSYFYKNSIAIVFPYLRSFISTLSLQANQSIMILPLMNLADLEPLLKERTIVK